MLMFSCSEGSDKGGMDEVENTQELENDTIKVLMPNVGYNEYYLDIIKSTANNTIVFQTRTEERIASVSGYGNTDLVLDDSGKIKVDTIDFNNDGIVEYMYSSYVIGSTYGAVVCYLVYSNNGWDVFRLPFDRLDVKYSKLVGEYVIVSYQYDNTVTYRFKSGVLIPLEPPLAK